MVPKIGTIFYDETIDNTVVLTNAVNESDYPPILTFCTLSSPNTIERFCYSFEMSDRNKSRFRNMNVSGFDKSFIPQKATRDNISANDPLITTRGLVFVMGFKKEVITCVDVSGFIRLYDLEHDGLLYKRDGIIPSRFLKAVLDGGFVYEEHSNLTNISTEKAYELYLSDKYACNIGDIQSLRELAFTSLANACKIQLKRNLVFGKKLDLSALEFTSCLDYNI